MPPSGFSPRAIEGLLIYTEACYEDLEQLVVSGKHRDFLAAIQYERQLMLKALSKLHITDEGDLVERPDSELSP